MKYKKYILVLLIMLLVSTNRVFALDMNTEVDSSLMLINNYTEQAYFGSLITEKEIPIFFATVDCTGLFGSASDPNSLRSLMDDIMTYFRIIVPILVIGLGTLDLAKAVIASKEDEMKKAQKTFVKRVIIGIAFFFTPVVIDIIMDLADLVWNGMYSTCGF